MSNIKKQDRYPGIRAFEQHESALFYGREQEIKDLFRLVKVEKLVVVFSKSGIGKSSLLNAGLSPFLEENEVLPIHLRLQNTSYSPLQILYTALEEYPKRTAPYTSQAKLWQQVKCAEFPNNCLPVLILDQFEEFFKHPIEARQAFTEQLAQLISEEVPEEVEQWLHEQPLQKRNSEMLEWYAPPKVRVILAIRSDRLSELNEMSLEIPSILHNRFELKTLNHKQAKEVIVKPAQLEDERFNTPSFVYDGATIEKIIDNLDPKNQNAIESFQLQILCGEIEKQVKTKVTSHSNQQLVVTPEYLGGKEGIQKILNDYYENRIAELGSESEQLIARKLIEEELIVEGNRSGVDARKVKITPELLEKLLSSRLIRVSNTHLGKSYEISHDTLVPPIMKSYERRKLEEEKLQRKRELEEERRKKRWALFVGVLGLGLFIGALGLVMYAIQQKNIVVEKSEKMTGLLLLEVDKLFLQLEYDQALEKINEVAELGVLQEEVSKRYMELAYWHTETHEYEKAHQILQYALQLNSNAEAQNWLKKKDSMEERNALNESLKAIDTAYYQFLEKRYYPTLIEVEGGQFTMGQGKSEHEAIVSNFAIAETETTLFQFALYCKATYSTNNLKIEEFMKISWGKEGIGLNPVIYINWHDVVRYCDWLSEQKGRQAKGFRLPTEAEWEYAASGGVKREKTLFSGSNTIGEVAWEYGNSKSRTQPVGSLQANELGLYDMSGNVWEWCFDWYADYPVDSIVTDYFVKENGTERVLRGGSWHDPSGACRVNYRNKRNPYDGLNDYGFRIASGL